MMFENSVALCGDVLSASGIRENTLMHDTTYSKGLMQLFAFAPKSLELQLQLLELAAFGHRWLSCRNRATTGNNRQLSQLLQIEGRQSWNTAMSGKKLQEYNEKGRVVVEDCKYDEVETLMEVHLHLASIRLCRSC